MKLAHIAAALLFSFCAGNAYSQDITDNTAVILTGDNINVTAIGASGQYDTFLMDGSVDASPEVFTIEQCNGLSSGANCSGNTAVISVGDNVNVTAIGGANVFTIDQGNSR